MGYLYQTGVRANSDGGTIFYGTMDHIKVIETCKKVFKVSIVDCWSDGVLE